ncbi:MAG: phosphatidate cytidylyltransferase [Candidatus Eremiobacteraeota bacterium]|nr:phosphatidate cytidylyltransferase [Candidatus Eremiobacteraeota bacterium]MBV9055166.1 phosphatidate cytidylyltransferase [Candidatus Eremiobacteraeota bacterium]MBV9700493.1 phosphatidate cytidylyltransferase [Candidatus Eremiobacteraeota bacterium]
MTERRVVVGLLVAAIGVSCVVVPWAFYVLLLAIGLASIYEFNYMCARKGQPLEYPVAALGVCAYVAMAVFDVLHKWEGVLLAAIVIAAFFIGMYGEQKGYFGRTAYTLLAVLYIGKLLSYFVFIRQIPGTGMWLTLYAIVLVALTDTFGMLVGMSLGRHPLTKISPKKTVEGSIGSLAIVTAIAIAATALPQLHVQWWQGAILGVFTSIAAQIGDLVESAFKRDAGVKDAGAAIAGHGGVLDRFDSYFVGGVTFFATLHVVGILQLQ